MLSSLPASQATAALQVMVWGKRSRTSALALHGSGGEAPLWKAATGLVRLPASLVLTFPAVEAIVYLQLDFPFEVPDKVYKE